MVNTGGIRVDLDGIMSALEKNGYDEVHIEFAPDGGSVDIALFDAVSRAVDAADAPLPERWSAGLTVSVTVASVRVKDFDGGPEDMSAWLDLVAQGLLSAGKPGSIYGRHL